MGKVYPIQTLTDHFLLIELTTASATNIHKLVLDISNYIQIHDIHKYNDMQWKSRGLKWATSGLQRLKLPSKTLRRVVPKSSHFRPLVPEGIWILGWLVMACHGDVLLDWFTGSFFYREPLLFMGKTMVPCNWSFQQIPWMLVQFSSTKLPGANVIHSHARDWPPPEGVFAAGVHPPKVMWPSWTMVSHPMWEKQWHVYHQFGNDKHT